eukprot:3123143-Pleurochrysis_carterae.AAC.1
MATWLRLSRREREHKRRGIGANGEGCAERSELAQEKTVNQKRAAGISRKNGIKRLQLAPVEGGAERVVAAESMMSQLRDFQRD